MSTTILQAGPNTPIATPADLRYRIADAGYATTGAKLPDGVTVMYDGAMLSDSDYALQFDGVVWNIRIAGADTPNDVAWSADGEFDNRDPRVTFTQNGESVEPSLLVPRTLADRTVNLITASNETSIDIELPAAVEEPTGVRRARDFLLDVDNSANASDLALEFTGLGVYYGFVTEADDDIGEMMTIAGYGTGSSGDGERVRLYFTECAMEGASGQKLFHVARVTLSADIDSIS